VLKYYGKGEEEAQLLPGLKPTDSPILSSGRSNFTANIINYFNRSPSSHS